METGDGVGTALVEHFAFALLQQMQSIADSSSASSN